MFCRLLEAGKNLGGDKNGLHVCFRPLRETDERLWELIGGNMDFLEACPTVLFMIESDEKLGSSTFWA